MIEELFNKYQIDINKCISYGFQRKDKNYIYQKKILKDSFLVEIRISNDKKVSGKVIDCSTQEEYTNIYVKNNTGEFVNKVKNAYQETLIEIRTHCFHRDYFQSNQANQITNFILEKYQSFPEFLWEDDDFSAIFRNQNNKKWFALITKINKKKLGEEDKEIEILNIKINPKQLDSLLKKKGFYPAYHMNKKKWMTISLNDKKVEEIIPLLEESYELVESRKKG